MITEYCILPLGFIPKPESDEEDAELVQAVPSVSTVLLYGPSGSGKTTLVNMVASEAGANLFNLSAKNTAGQFVGKANVTKMVHMVFKVAKATAPSIIYIDNFELIFAKKIPKEDQTDPKRIRKDLLKQFKNLSPADRVVVMACSSKPWEAEAKLILPIFQKFILCPKPDYPSRYSLWYEFIHKKIPLLMTGLNLSLLAHLSEHMSTGQIFLCCERAMTNRRMKLVFSFNHS